MGKLVMVLEWDDEDMIDDTTGEVCVTEEEIKEGVLACLFPYEHASEAFEEGMSGFTLKFNKE